ncbi:MAG: glycoside hydrolase family 88/105 protein [Puniceicoccales bacterium]
MKKTLLKTMACLMVCSLSTPASGTAEEMSREEILTLANDMAMDQFDAMGWNFWGRFWIDGVFFAGVVELAEVTDNPSLFDAIFKMGKMTRSNPAWHMRYVDEEKEPNHADDFAIGQAFLAAYEKEGDPEILVDTQRRLDQATEVILSEEMAEKAANAEDLEWNEGLTYYWIDALFMAGPVHARLSEITGDPKYLKALNVEWKRVSDLLYDEDEDLYYRDAKYMSRNTRNGEKVFWSRGNGWVMGAFALTLPYIPENDPQRDWYIAQFEEMSAKMASIQRPNGSWSPSLLDYDDFPYSEMSCTGLTVFAIAWGINNGILDEATYRPVVEKGWAALLAAIDDEGFLGYVQGVGAEPGKVYSQQHTWYGNGAFLLAAVELSKMAPINVPEIPPLTSAGEQRK